ncbi:MAG: lysylphosphatidylglycerol synthase transmembrane domain-containing protein [Pseudomonadota bacterium]
MNTRSPWFWVRLAGLVAVAAFFVWLLLAETPLEEIGQQLASIPPWALLLGVGFLATGYFFRIVRWWVLLRALDPSLPLSAPVWPFLVSIALNNVLPFRAGDAVRIFGFRKRLSAPISRVFGTVLIERLADLAVLAAVTAIGLAILGSEHGLAGLVLAVIIALGLGFGGLVVAIALSPWILRWLARRGQSSGRLARLAGPASSFMETLLVLRKGNLAAQLVGLSLLAWLFEGLVFVAIAQGLGIAAQGYAPWFSLGAGTLGTLIPSTPGHVGTFDYLASLGMQAFDVPAVQAVAYALAVHAVLWLPLTAVGLGYLAVMGKRTALAPLAGRSLRTEEKQI